MGKTKFNLICGRRELENAEYLVRAIEYKKRTTSAVIFVYDGAVYAYVNYCMHMHRALDCQEDAIFDAAGELLRCSMHGFVFEPTTGECLSPVCAGQRLQSLKIVEDEKGIFFVDKHVKLI